jgi:hypothetical protein
MANPESVHLLNRITIDDAAIFELANRTRTQSELTRAAALSGRAVDAVKPDGEPGLGIDVVELGGSGTTWKELSPSPQRHRSSPRQIIRKEVVLRRYPGNECWQVGRNLKAARSYSVHYTFH